MRKKVYLLSYSIQQLQALSVEGTQYELETLEISWFGLVKRTVKSIYTVPLYSRNKAYTDHWDNLIKNKLPLK